MALVVADVLGDLIVDQLALLMGSAQAEASREARQLIHALSEWAQTQGAGEVRLALDQLAERIAGDPPLDEWSDTRTPVQ